MKHRIGELARLTGTKVETIRWYEREGLMPAPERGGGNYRSYDDAALARLGFIRRARRLGFPLAQVRELLDQADRRDADCGAVDAIARARLAEIEVKIADLAQLREELGDLLASCGRDRIAGCRVVGALVAGR